MKINGEKISLTRNESSSNSIPEVLGIKDSRSDDLAEFCEERTLNTDSNISEDMESIMDNCETIEEFAYSMYVFGCRVGEKHTKAELVTGALNKLLGRDKDEDDDVVNSHI